jgi:hypothetical protein
MPSPSIRRCRFFISSLLTLIMLPSMTVAQTCKDYIPDLNPNSRYTNHNDGTVTDIKTGLMWKQCVEGLSGSDCATGSDTTHTWKQALELADATYNNASSGFAGHTDWRLPNHKELLSLTAKNCYDPSINAAMFPNTPASGVWSSSPNANNSYYAWYVYFNYGDSAYNDRNDSRSLRLVRSRQ